MKKKWLLTAAFITILFLSELAATQMCFVSGNFFPEHTPLGIRINSDGTVEGTDSIQRSDDVYALTGDIYDTIVVLRDGIVLDGAGYSLRGNGSGTGIFLQGRNNVVIKNMKISNFDYGIKFTWSSYGSQTPPASKLSPKMLYSTTHTASFFMMCQKTT